MPRIFQIYNYATDVHIEVGKLNLQVHSKEKNAPMTIAPPPP